MSDFRIIDVAYGALLHDIGKFYQRTMVRSDLKDNELDVTPYNKKGNYNSHLHSGYTSRFLREYLNMNSELERITSEHHKDNLDRYSIIIKDADRLASAIDRQDEQMDYDTENKKGNFIRARLSSVLNEVDFGEHTEVPKMFPLSTSFDMTLPTASFQYKSLEESADEYKTLFQQFIKEVKNNDVFLKSEISMNTYHLMFNLLNKYLVTIPASTYESMKTSVSLFDHLKITSAIASCLHNQTCYESKKFYMLEIDISGIQNFIYQILEGSENKRGLTKALRGRSSLVGLISNATSYAFLNEFELTESNILFNSGGGSTILLPFNSDTKDRVDKTAKQIRKSLFSIFQTDITFVNALIELNAEELEEFKTGKAIELKQELGKNKMHKFSDIIDSDFFFEKIENNETCKICGRIMHKGKCDVCSIVEGISDVFTKNDNFGIVYDFNKKINLPAITVIDLEFVRLIFVKEKERLLETTERFYVDSVNHFEFGNQRMISNLVPLNKNNEILNFEQIVNLTPKEFGDSKLAILKMDVDNLGGIFAFGLKNNDKLRFQRSISKYVTMSRLLEYFFGYEIKNICVDVSKQVQSNINRLVCNGTLFYINYAGGDDLVIMGSVYSILLLSLEIYKRFKDFAGNPNITISGGIHIQRIKEPIRFGIQEAERELEKSKDADGKNSITLIDTTVSFNDYEDLLNESLELQNLINQKELSRTMIYNIMSFVSNRTKQEFNYLVPRIYYTLYRNINNNDLLSKMKRMIEKIDNDSDLKKYVLILKLAILFTRNNEEE